MHRLGVLHEAVGECANLRNSDTFYFLVVASEEGNVLLESAVLEVGGLELYFQNLDFLEVGILHFNRNARSMYSCGWLRLLGILYSC